MLKLEIREEKKKMLMVYLGLILLFHFGFVGFLVNQKLHTVDLLWGLAHGVVALGSFFFLQGTKDIFNWLFLFIILAWSLRLFLYLLIRNWNKPDDRRYIQLASDWRGGFSVNAYFRIFLVQMVISAITSLSIVLGFNVINSNIIVFGFFTGFSISIVGLIYESVADLQLFNFKKNNPGKRLYGQGLYKYSRHPNYFGEIIFWWGVFIMSISKGAPWWGVVSPLTINFLIIKFSGVPFHQKITDDDGFNSYVKTTNAVCPNFLKR